jgi:hypothetical protein
MSRLIESGRQDLNLRPPAPHAGALAKLRHAPFIYKYFSTRRIIKQIFFNIKNTIKKILLKKESTITLLDSPTQWMFAMKVLTM